tara:strand:+ start:3553 stop:4317 length:765 start_codon:yes stop_codon:yes gene_type:complete
MTETGQVYKAFNKFQSSMTAMEKGEKNPRFGSMFAGLDSVAKVADGMYKFDLSWTQRIESNENEDFVVTEVMHSDGSKLPPSIMRLYFNKKTISNEGKPVATMQQFMSAVTYARRCSLMAICGMSTNDKDGNDLSEDLDFENEDEEKEFNLQQDTSSQTNNILSLKNGGKKKLASLLDNPSGDAKDFQEYRDILIKNIEGLKSLKKLSELWVSAGQQYHKWDMVLYDEKSKGEVKDKDVCELFASKKQSLKKGV